MAWNLGLLGAASFVPAPIQAYDLLESVVLSTTPSGVSFTNLVTKYAADYQHLQLRVTARSNRGDTDSVLRLQVNGDGGANYATHNLGGNGSSVASSTITSSSTGGFYMPYTCTGATAPTNLFADSIIDILDPFETTKYSTMRALIGQPSPVYSRLALQSGVYMNTAAITSLNVIDIFSTYTTGSRFSLYGLKAA